MNIIKLANSIDRTDSRLETDINWSALYELIENYNWLWPDDKNTQLKCYWLQCWYCTDSRVGMRAYFLDDKLIAISTQIGRKYSQEFEFVSHEAFKKLKYYLESLIEEEPKIDIISETLEINERYTVEYSGQLIGQIHKFGYLKKTGERVEIIGAADDCKRFHLVEIKTLNGEIKRMDCREIEFEYGKAFEGEINRI